MSDWRTILRIAMLVVGACTVLLSASERGATDISVVLGRPTDRSIALNILPVSEVEVHVEYGTEAGHYTESSAARRTTAGVPLVVAVDDLAADTAYFYRVMTRRPGQSGSDEQLKGSFHTQRRPGTTFMFALQGDSHPEREGKMFDPDLYRQTLRNVAADRPDFCVMLGDDFSIERLIARKALSQRAVDQVYARQRDYLSAVGDSSAIFLVNGNHEQAAECNLDGSANSSAVLAGLARTNYFPLPAPDGFYGGDEKPVDRIGLLRDYYAWTWGDALFVVIDPYWHSPVPVDNEAGVEQNERSGKKNARRDLWQVTIGDEQYRWLTKTLSESRAKWKFVFAHHVLGTGRGGIEEARLYEWGGKDRRGDDGFAAHRPAWAMPIHDLFVKTGVTIFFQGHDHLYARQELDGVVYQSCPNPADPSSEAFNREAYRSGVILPNSGHLRVTVAPDAVRVDYVRSFLPADESPGKTNSSIGHGYTIQAKGDGK